MFVDHPLDAEIFLKDAGAQAAVKAIADQIAAMHKADPDHALSVSLNGAWGTGKSTYLKALEYNFANDGCPVVHFEAWRYAMEPDIFLALLEVMYENEALKGSAKGMLKKAMKLFGVASLVGAEAYLKATLNVGLDDITKAFKLVEDEVERQSTLTSKAKKQLDSVVRKIREAYKSGDMHPPLVLAVDDLDRLPPDTAYSLLEKLRFYFDSPGIIVIMAVNDEVINTYAHERHGIDRNHISEDFLDKIFQYRFDLSYAPLGDLHFTGWKSSLNKNDVKDTLSDQILQGRRFPHRKWINILNRLEYEGCPDYLSLAQKCAEVALRELYPAFNYAWRKNPDVLLDSASPDYARLFAEIEKDSHFGPELFDTLWRLQAAKEEEI